MGTKAPTHVEDGTYMLRPRLAGTRRLMIKIPGTPPCHLTTSQSEESHTPAALAPNVTFKNASLKTLREFGSFEHKLPIHLAWSLQ